MMHTNYVDVFPYVYTVAAYECTPLRACCLHPKQRHSPTTEWLHFASIKTRFASAPTRCLFALATAPTHVITSNLHDKVPCTQ
jgi:hypothetical protein